MTENLNRALDLLQDTIVEVPSPGVYSRLREVERLLQGYLELKSEVYPSDRLLCGVIRINMSQAKRMKVPFEKQLSVELSNVRRKMLEIYREHSG